MENRKMIIELIKQFSGQANILAIPRAFIDLTDGDIHTALLLNQITYWAYRTKDKDGWFYKSYKDWDKELSMSKYHVSKSVNKLKSFGVLETKVRKVLGVPTLHYRLNWDEFQKWIVNSFNYGKSEDSTMGSANPSLSSLTETTTETTTESKDSSPKDKQLTEPQQWVRVLCDVAGMDDRIKSNAGRMARLGSELRKAKYTIEDVLAAYGEKGRWYATDWRGKQGQPPTPTQIKQTIKVMTHYTKGNGGIKRTNAHLPDKVRQDVDFVNQNLAFPETTKDVREQLTKDGYGELLK